MTDPLAALSAVDPEIADIVRRELERQNTTIQLIASENFTSPAVLAAQGSVLTNKYSEGYPGKRYYGGNFVVDEAEELARRRALRALRRRARERAAALGRERQHGRVPRAARAGRQGHGDAPRPGRPPHARVAGQLQRPPLRLRRLRRRRRAARRSTTTRSATSRTRAAPEDDHRRRDRVPAHHRLRGVPRRSPTTSARCCSSTPRTSPGSSPAARTRRRCRTPTSSRSPRTRRCAARARARSSAASEYAAAIDKAVFPGLQGGPLMHVDRGQGGRVPRGGAARRSATYAAQIVRNARALADALAGEGFRIVSGGTDNHLMLVDLRPFGVTGKVAQEALDRAGITCNKNAIPNDPEKPFVTSGLRLGTAAVHDRGHGRARDGRDRGAHRAGAARAVDDDAGRAARCASAAPASARSSRRTPTWHRPSRASAASIRGRAT